MVNMAQVMRLDQSPSYRLSLAQRLEQEREEMNNGTWAGGLASMINAGTAGYLRGKDNRDRTAADEALASGYSEGAGIGTMDGQQPNAPRIMPGPQGAEANLAALKGNPYASRYSSMLAMQRAQMEQEAQQRAEQRSYQEGLMKQKRGWQVEDRDVALANRPAKTTYKTVTGEDAGGMGLDPNGVYSIGSNGQVSVLQQPPQRKAPTTREFTLADGSTVLAQYNMETGNWDPVPLPEGATPGRVSGQKPMTEAQSKNVIYATRAKGALETLNTYGTALTSIGDRALDSDPTGVVRGEFQSEDYQMGKTAGNEFLQAILRKDTGAAITNQEQDLYGGTYLPQPGDGPRVLAYKEGARQRAIDALEAGMMPQEILAQEKALAKDRTPNMGGQQAGPLGNGIVPSPDDGQGGSGRTRFRYNPQTGELEPAQ